MTKDTRRKNFLTSVKQIVLCDLRHSVEIGEDNLIIYRGMIYSKLSKREFRQVMLRLSLLDDKV